MKYTYTFDQLRETDDNVLRRFVCYEYTIRDYGAVDLDRYYTVDYGVVDAPDPETACERLFSAYNVDKRPGGYTGRSMSVSDIVRLWDNSTEPPTKTTWFCDSIGFQRLEDQT